MNTIVSTGSLFVGFLGGILFTGIMILLVCIGNLEAKHKPPFPKPKANPTPSNVNIGNK